MSTVLKGGQVFTEGKLVTADVLIEDKKIVKIGVDLTGDTIVDISGKILLPGFIDTHVHFRDPGHPHKEDFASGSYAAAAGGVTTVCDMPNNTPSVVDQAGVDDKITRAKKSIVNVGLYVGATADNIEQLNQVSHVVAIKAYLGSSTGSLLLDKVEDFAKLMETTNHFVVVHAEEERLIKYFAQKYGSTKMHHKMRDNLAAVIATSRAGITAKYYGKRLHIAHMSTKEEVEFIRKYKSNDLSCEVCPHHLFLTKDFFETMGNEGKMNPPLRYDEDQKALWDGIRDGTVDMIATDHAPHTPEEKAVDFEKAPCGVPGVQTTLPLMLNEVARGTIELADAVRLCSTRPAELFGMKGRGEIKEGNFADLVVIDMEKEYTIENNDQLSKCGWSPFHGRTCKGWPVATYVNGNLVYENVSETGCEHKIYSEKEGMIIEPQN